MCAVCGCGTARLADAPERGLEGPGAPLHIHERPHDHDHDHDHDHHHHHGHDHVHGHGHEQSHSHEEPDGRSHAHEPGREGRHGPVPAAIDFGAGDAGVSVPGLSQARTIRIERAVLSKNKAYADDNRRRLRQAGVFAINLLSSPGSGKTTLLVRTIKDLKGRWPMAVIEGDQQTSLDAKRIRDTGVQAVQINTGKGCHLDAFMVGRALEEAPLEPGGLLFIENVGNLVCPAAFDLGEACKVVVLSTTEGEDKPLKYPDMFAAADLMLLNKSDLLPHLDFDVDACFAAALRVNPRLQILSVSARTGEGLRGFYAWIEGRAAPLERTTGVG